ncbi:MAG: hypothetical protein UR52_C0023G0001, partial [Candidatus Gottesmanbacteria bacterium GW2011_GWA1_34_13]
SYNHDQLTQSHRRIPEFKQAGLNIIKLKGTHSSSIIHPDILIDKVYKKTS